MLSTPLCRRLAYGRRQCVLPSILSLCASPASGGQRGRGTKTPEPSGPGCALPAPGHPRPPASPQRVFPGSATAHHRRPLRRSGPGSPAASCSQAPGAGTAAGTAREPRTHRARPDPARPHRGACAGPPPPAGACASPASCCAAAVPPRYRAASGPGLGQSRSCPRSTPLHALRTWARRGLKRPSPPVMVPRPSAAQRARACPWP